MSAPDYAYAYEENENIARTRYHIAAIRTHVAAGTLSKSWLKIAKDMESAAAHREELNAQGVNPDQETHK